jgi:hypothetical protein
MQRCRKDILLKVKKFILLFLLNKQISAYLKIIIYLKIYKFIFSTINKDFLIILI